MEWIKASHIEKNITYKEKKIYLISSFLPTELEFGLFVV